MKPLPSTEDPLVIRTDFTDDAAWREIQRSIGAPVGDQGFLAHVTFVDDRAFDPVKHRLHLSITHEHGHAAAVAVWELVV